MVDTPDPLKAIRRFYEGVSVGCREGAFEVRLDGRVPRSPGGRPLALPTRALADLIAGEWEAQGESIAYGAMPATRLAHTALDVVPKARAATIEGVVRYASADLLCYFADHPASLIHRQEHSWGPLLAWADRDCGLRFTRAVGIVHRPQPPETLARLGVRLDSLDDHALSGVAFASALFGSAILALALRAGRINADQAMAAARLDELFQEDRWGVDAEAEAKADAMAVDAVMVERWFGALAG